MGTLTITTTAQQDARIIEAFVREVRQFLLSRIKQQEESVGREVVRAQVDADFPEVP